MQRAGFVCRPCLAAMRRGEAALRPPLRATKQLTTGEFTITRVPVVRSRRQPSRKLPKEGPVAPRHTVENTTQRQALQHELPLPPTLPDAYNMGDITEPRPHDDPQQVQRELDATGLREQALSDEDPEFDSTEDFGSAELKSLEDLMRAEDELPPDSEAPPSKKARSVPMDRIRQYRRLMRETIIPERRRACKRFQIWKRDFALAWRDQLRDHSQQTAKLSSFTPKDSGEEQLRILLKKKDVIKMRDKWRTMSLEARIQTWPHVMADALRVAPDRAHEVLEATFEESVVPFYAVRDVASFLVKRYHLSVREERPAADQYGRRLASTIIQVLRESRPGYVDFTQHTLYTIAKVSDANTLLDLYATLREYQHEINPLTKLHFISGVGKVTAYKKHAVEIFRDVVQEDLDETFTLDSIPVMAACTTMLAFPEQDAKDTELGETRAYILEELVSLGIKPNLITFTAIVRNLCLAHDLENALEVFQLVREHGITPDLHLYSILINGCKYLGNFRVMSQLIRTMVQETECKDPIVWNDVIHAVHYIYSVNIEHGSRIGPWGIRVVPAFQPMLQVYAKFFDLEPLQRLLPMHELRRFLQDARDPKLGAITQGPWRAKVEGLLGVIEELEPQCLEPTTETLTIMLSGFLRSHSSVYPVVSFYAVFRRMIAAGQKEATQIAQSTTAVHDNVIRYLGRWPGMLRVALDVVNDMLSSQTPADGKQPTTGKHPAPSIYTWSILLHALMHSKQLEQGERLLEAMRERGIEPTRVTWNTLIAGYARSQSVEETTNAMVRAEDAGWKKDDFTLRAFQHLIHQEEALGLLEETLERRAKMLPDSSADPTAEFSHLQRAVDEIQTSFHERDEAAAIRALRDGVPPPQTMPSLHEVANKTWDCVHDKPKYSLIIGDGVDQAEFESVETSSEAAESRPYKRTQSQPGVVPIRKWQPQLFRKTVVNPGKVSEEHSLRRTDVRTRRTYLREPPQAVPEEDSLHRTDVRPHRTYPKEPPEAARQRNKTDENPYAQLFEQLYEQRRRQQESGQHTQQPTDEGKSAAAADDQFAELFARLDNERRDL